jgi:hypothetical protein
VRKPQSRINIIFDDEELLYLRVSASERGCTMTSLIRQSVRLHKALQREKKAGNSLYAGRNGQIDKEVIIP